MYPIASPESPSTTQGHDYPVESPLSDSLVELEGWVRLSESPNGIPSSDISWLKEDTQRGLFTPVQIYKDNTGLFKRRQVMKSDRMWFYPPEPPGYVRGALPTPQLFFRSRLFVWRPVGVWRYSLKRPRGPNSVGDFVPALGGQWDGFVRLDIFHWIHRFEAAIRTDSHSKYTAFKSALAGAVLAYNRTDLELLIKAVRAKDPATLKSVSDEDVVRHYISREQLKHHEGLTRGSGNNPAHPPGH
ncbi:hypothetical protein SKAU_G00103380 [Synaphobranchus kaupii]|uniref:DUF6729 domain-containing protein n=1 Tax=Synaphobranchus kaupii TaxID=118154 RepID=A0A9Q1FZ08_SYNKA|nr:hypothetical protein SKAU_G00103380 [Synaphobranchus kaupii]